MQQVQRTSLAREVYSELLGAIVHGVLAPGERIRDVELAATLGVSRTPVREALLRLQDEGLVESVPGSHIRIAPIDVEAVTHAFVVAAGLHGLAARLGAPAATADDLDAMSRANHERTAALQEGDVVEAIAADERFHQVLVDRAGNPELESLLQRVLPKIRRLDYLHFSDLEPEASAGDHEAIIAACTARDGSRAGQLVEANFLALGRVVTAALGD
jgi:DNA-binding GntR family transcriptional regulator